jgi:type I restriction enzyme, S subunit
MKIADLKPYVDYKDLGLPWLEQVPSHWSLLRAKNLFREVDQRSTTGLEELLSVSHITGVTPRSQKSITMFLAKSNVGHKLCQPDDVVINTMWAWMGALGVSRHSGLVSPAYGVYRPRPDSPLLPRFADHLLRTPIYSSEYERRSTGVNSSRLRLYPEHFLRIPIIIPPPNEQDVIVRFLGWANSRLDRTIRAKRKVIALFNEQKQAIIHRAVTRGLAPSVRLKPSGLPWLGNIPEHWEVMPLGRVLKERIEKNDPIKTDNILSLSLHDGVIPYAEKRSGGNKAKDDLTAYKLAYPGDIVLNSMNVVVGSVGLSKYFGAVSPVYYMLRPRNSSDIVAFFDALFHDPAFQRSLFGLGNGIMFIQSKSTGKLNTIRMRIPMGKLNRVDIPYPPANEQTMIVQSIEAETVRLDTVISRLDHEIELLIEYRTRLISDVVTGKLDVREAAKHLPADADLYAAEDLGEDSNESESEDEEIEA